MSSNEIEIPAGDGRMPAYCARPAAGKASPVVVVLHEIYGLDAQIRETCDRFAEAGYLAIAPYLFFRQRDVDMIPDTGQIVSKIVSRVPDAQVITDLDAIVRWAKTEGDIGRLGVAECSWGGRIVWLYAAHSKQLKAGAVERMKAALKPSSQIVLYESVGHGFNAGSRESYNEHAAVDSWRRMLEFFGEHLQ